MDIQAEKYELIAWITSLTDISLINRLKEVRETADNDWWDKLSREEREGIENGLRDHKAGRVHSHEDVMARFKKRVGL